MKNDVSKKMTTRVGYVAADATQKEFESGKKVTNVTILSGSGEKKQATYVRGWNAMAERLQNIKKGEKWEFRGQLTSETKDDRTYDIMNARESYPHIKMEVQGEVKHIEDKNLGKTDMTNVMIISSEIEGGKAINQPYNIELYGDKNMAKAKDIKVGDIVSTQGHVRMYEYMKNGENRVVRSFQNPYEINNHTKTHAKEVQQEVTKGNGKKKSKGKEMNM